ncbi:hypothetical protein [Streptomyces sp. NPDC046727]|uniref:hypothetical protein n=1 Tax=Streptomyces sp. NPDC046727 TaxID=3155373 RepID=UPI0033FE27E5
MSIARWKAAGGAATEFLEVTSINRPSIGNVRGLMLKLRVTATTGIRWAAMTQSQLNMIVLKVPVGSHEVSIAARVSLPYHFDGTRYTGN